MVMIQPEGHYLKTGVMHAHSTLNTSPSEDECD